MQKSTTADAMREIAQLANELRTAQENVTRLTTEIWKKSLVLSDLRPSLSNSVEGLIDFDRSVFDKRPPVAHVVRSVANVVRPVTPRLSGKEKHAVADSATNRIMATIAAAGRPLRADEIHKLGDMSGELNNTQAIVSTLKNSGFLIKDDRQRPALWSLGPRGLERVRLMKEQSNA